MRFFISRFVIPSLITSVCLAAGTPASTFDMSGTATFEAPTTVPGVEVKGVSNSVNGHLTIARDDRGLALEHIEVVIPVKSLATGMKVRDEHMRKYIFTDSNSQTPDIRFSAGSIFCTANPGSQEFPCEVGGTLTIRGTAHAFSMKLYVRQQSGGHSGFRAAGDAVVKLSDYGISPPRQFGVTTANDVKLHLDFSAKQGTSASAAAGGER
jgi:polyisoprenoid-binding protein YceI